METSNLAQKFADDLAEITWSDIKPHAQRDVVIIIDSALDMVDVGVAIAEDQTTKVQHWIEEALVQKPSQEQLSQWNAEPGTMFETLIVQPYVLISDKTRSSTDSSES